MCTVDNHWWWAQKITETCRVLWQKWILDIDASSWLFLRNFSRCTVTYPKYFSRTFRVSIKTQRIFWVGKWMFSHEINRSSSYKAWTTVCRSVVQHSYKHSLLALRSMTRLRYGKQILKRSRYENSRMCVRISESCGMWTDETVV